MTELTLNICRPCKKGPYRFEASLRRVLSGSCDNCDNKMDKKSPGHVVYVRDNPVIR